MKKHSKNVFLWASAVLWLVLITGGMVTVWAHSGVSGPPAELRTDWPPGSQITRPRNRPILVIALHPQCGCSQASLSELERLMAGRADRMSIAILLCCPHGAPADWTDTSLAKRAATIPGASLLVDRDNAEARRFGAKTSGQTFLFDRNGRRVFAGGITDGRGHEGDNPGIEMIAALVDGKPVPTSTEGLTTPVFGCSLFSTSSPTAP